ncbi:uncharacterized protein PHALS_14429 [Plasmopara halstedii]|uniref:Uncharacterized protein n=1 Tax=Plasmopara halstedii TaxID=4781 RepID=A0A0N7L6G0_PLAHL|nr:uncharacterized protein PHALS_14429 [Plasmopara halstedii]CEG44171.1 hypothetical protein PHALS_14429 [Plasmopara halstedii]|eukprot:XP_024580540.1 hypothetical protein PHALS_14429 [Plasmopara halstedii]
MICLRIGPKLFAPFISDNNTLVYLLGQSNLISLEARLFLPKSIQQNYSWSTNAFRSKVGDYLFYKQ